MTRSSSVRRPLRPHGQPDRRAGTPPAASGAQGLLTGKVGAAFTSTASRRGGRNLTLFSILFNLLTSA